MILICNKLRNIKQYCAFEPLPRENGYLPARMWFIESLIFWRSLRSKIEGLTLRSFLSVCPQLFSGPKPLDRFS
jgi:hypothetical protein